MLVGATPFLAQLLSWLSCSAVQVVGDVLQRFCDALQTALELLIMLSSCVADADDADPQPARPHCLRSHQ
jgi:hypothetical protein